MLRLQRILTLNLVFLLLLLGCKATFAGPEFYAQEMTHDFGDIEQYTRHKHIFKFENRGDEDLIIHEVKPSCGCTAALLSAKVIPPGGKGEIEVNFDSGKFRGKVKKYVAIVTNEKRSVKKGKTPSDDKLHQLKIYAFVKYDKKKAAALQREREEVMRRSKEEAMAKAKEAAKIRASERKDSDSHKAIDFHPKKIALGNIKVGTEHRQTVKLINSSDTEYKISMVTVSIPGVSIMINKIDILKHNPGEITVSAIPQLQGSVDSSKVYIYVVGEKYPIEVPISWDAK